MSLNTTITDERSLSFFSLLSMMFVSAIRSVNMLFFRHFFLVRAVFVVHMLSLLLSMMIVMLVALSE